MNSQQKKYKIAIIESDFAALKEFQRAITFHNRLELDANLKSGRGATTYFKASTPDIVILNPVLPDVNGFELMLSLDKKIPTIVANSNKELAYYAFRIQAVDFVLKPINYRLLEEALDRAVAMLDAKN